MNERIKVFVLTAAVVLCTLYALTPAFGAIDVPDKLKEFPLFEGSKVVQAMDMEEGSMLNATVKASADSVSDFYKNSMKGSGWKLVFQMDEENSKVLHFQKGEQIFQVTVQAEEGEGPTTYNLVLHSK